MPSLNPNRFITAMGVCVALILVLLILSPGVGTESGTFTWSDAWRARLGLTMDRAELARRPYSDLNRDGSLSDDEARSFAEQARYIGFDLRMARSLLALQVGATLALCGAVLQVLFRNPLAEPYTLGIASGGSLGALLCIRFGWLVSFLGISSVAICAFAGGVTVVGAALAATRRTQRMTSNELLLGGVATGLFCGAMMMLVTAVSNERMTFEAVRWMMGSLDPIARVPGAVLVPVLLPVWMVLIALAPKFNPYGLGDDLAATRGVHVARLRWMSVLLTTLATAAVVAECGPIGFVGLVVPQIVRLLFGSDCRILLPASALLGAAFLIVCDWGSQLVMRLAGWTTGRQLGSATLPIGVITAIVGVPVFLVLLRARKK